MITENGWPSCTRAQCDDVAIPGTGGKLVLPFQHGIPAVILPAFMGCLHQFVESANNSRGYADEGSWTGTNSVPTSNHLGGTAFDYNWDDHPMGIALDGWHGSDIINGEEEPEIRRILEYFTMTLRNGQRLQLVWWANDWDSPKDSMHFQMGYGTYDHQVEIWEWINTHIDKDGFALYRRDGKPQGGAPIPQQDLAKLLGDAMGNVPGVDYDELLPYYSNAMRRMACNNNNRLAMAAAQLGHESVGLKYMKEIGDANYFAKYNNRADLGNGPSDGPRYPGRGPIQVTGRLHYRELSQWAYDNGLVPTPTYFEDNPEMLERLEFAFDGTVWYWTEERPDINALSDAGNVVEVTHRINGGENGLADRINRWNHCRTMDLMPLLGIEDGFLMALSDKEQRELYNEIMKRGPSRAVVAEDGNLIETLLGFIYNIDGNVWDARLVLPYLLDVPYAVEQVERVAAGGPAPDSWAASNEFVAEFGQAVCKALVEFKPRFKAVFDPPAPKKRAPAKKKA